MFPGTVLRTPPVYKSIEKKPHCINKQNCFRSNATSASHDPVQTMSPWIRRVFVWFKTIVVDRLDGAHYVHLWHVSVL